MWIKSHNDDTKTSQNSNGRRTINDGTLYGAKVLLEFIKLLLNSDLIAFIDSYFASMTIGELLHKNGLNLSAWQRLVLKSFRWII